MGCGFAYFKRTAGIDFASFMPLDLEMPGTLIDYWKRCELQSFPHLHPDDAAMLYGKGGVYVDDQTRDLAGFVASSRFGNFKDNRLHLGLYPIPYSGRLATADIVLLTLNPGFNLTDYYGETVVPEFRERLVANLHQTLEGGDFPFMWLDPSICWHSGYQYWEKKLRGVLQVIAQRKGISYLDALRSLSRRLAHVELLPYHSQDFNARNLVAKLPSANMAREFVKNNLEAAAANGSKTVVATRAVRAWGLASGTKIIAYNRGQARGASLGPKTPGGKAILKRFGIC
ncbi:hypothetical protein [Taklimakanibacter deserti]|uniref:hypothetical protein n=1 Tax=Taklimakanibacter deserti TaxID=2267839 RepID=UPI0013C4582E